MNEQMLARELSSTEATRVLSHAFGKVLARVDAPKGPDYLAAAQAAGRCIQHAQRFAYTDLWPAYDALHLALGLPMDWRGGYAHTAIDLPAVLGYVLRSLETPDILNALASADREFRRVRLTHYRNLQAAEDALIKTITDHAKDHTTFGNLKRADDVRRLAETRATLRAEKAVLFGAYVTVHLRRYDVTLDTDLNSDDAPETKVTTKAPCPNCHDAEWSYTRTSGGTDQLVCECGYHLTVEGM